MVQFVDGVRAAAHQDSRQLWQAHRHRVARLVPRHVDQGFDSPRGHDDARRRARLSLARGRRARLLTGLASADSLEIVSWGTNSFGPTVRSFRMQRDF